MAERRRIGAGTAIFLAGAGRMDQGWALFAEASGVEPRSAEHMRRFLAAGFLPAQVGPLIDTLEACTAPV